jgi:hypothetical protein
MFKLNFRTLPLAQQNQARLPLEQQNQARFPNINKKQTRQILHQENIDLQTPLNEIVSNKTIINNLDRTNGFGDFLRGSILLAEIAKKYKIKFKIVVDSHPISNFLEIQNKTPVYTDVSINYMLFHDDESKLIPLIQQFISSDEEVCVINTNLYYNPYLVTNDIKHYINTFFTFKPEYYEKAKQLTKNKKYNVLHIRCTDENFNSEFHSDYLLVEIIKLKLGKDTIIMSNNCFLKKKLNKIFGFDYIDIPPPVHTGHIYDDNELESTIIDYIILSKSSHTYCISFYHHGSGFSEHCSVLNNIPYTLTYLPNESIITYNTKESINNTSLLLNHYNKRIEWLFEKCINCDDFVKNPSIL